VRTAVAWSGTTRTGFAMYVPVDEVPGELDLVAIAVEPAWQARGVGRALLAFVEDEARTLAGGRSACSVRLTVAEDNAVARGLFEGTGYRPIDGEHGRYDGGQRSMGLRKRLH
jgi:ribosomal protein S18 acetylase RimI-like enzyme